VNEFRSSRYAQVMPNGKELGEIYLIAKGLNAEKYWVWLGIIINWVLLVVYGVAATAALAYIDHSTSYGTASSEQVTTTTTVIKSPAAPPPTSEEEVRRKRAATIMVYSRKEGFCIP